jgi:hypothetical protein
MHQCVEGPGRRWKAEIDIGQGTLAQDLTEHGQLQRMIRVAADAVYQDIHEELIQWAG